MSYVDDGSPAVKLAVACTVLRQRNIPAALHWALVTLPIQFLTDLVVGLASDPKV
jgi:hypothetical protein